MLTCDNCQKKARNLILFEPPDRYVCEECYQKLTGGEAGPAVPAAAGESFGPPAAQAGYPPAPPVTGAYPPPAAGYPPQPGAGYPPQPGTGYPPQPGTGYPPQPGTGYPPQPAQGYPAATGVGYGPPQPGYAPPPAPPGAAGYPYTTSTGYGPPQPGYPPHLSEAPPPAYGPPGAPAGVDEDYYPESAPFEESVESKADSARSTRNSIILIVCVLAFLFGIFMVYKQIQKTKHPPKDQAVIAIEQQAIDVVKASRARTAATVNDALVSYVAAQKANTKELKDNGWLATDKTGAGMLFSVSYIVDVAGVRNAFTWDVNVKYKTSNPTNAAAQKL